MDIGQIPGYRTLLVIAGFGAVAYAYRVITNKEQGFFGGAE
jgi:hypothetical protein